MKVTPSLCPYCAVQLNSASSLSGGRGPQVGDLSLCFTCGGYLMFDDDMAVIRLPESAVPPDMRAQLRIVSLAIKKFHRERTKHD